MEVCAKVTTLGLATALGGVALGAGIVATTVPSSEAPHSQIGVKEGRKGDYRQTRQWSEDGKLQKTPDWTNHGRKDHASPHDHISSPNTTGGTPKRDDGVPWSLTL